MEIWHNPRCAKSRQTLQLIEEAGVEPRIRRYLDDPPTAPEIGRALDALGLEPWEITRTKEKRAVALGVASLPRDRDAWIQLLAANPALIERPIVIGDDGRAVLGRPPENVSEILGR